MGVEEINPCFAKKSAAGWRLPAALLCFAGFALTPRPRVFSGRHVRHAHPCGPPRMPGRDSVKSYVCSGSRFARPCARLRPRAAGFVKNSVFHGGHSRRPCARSPVVSRGPSMRIPASTLAIFSKIPLKRSSFLSLKISVHLNLDNVWQR